MKTLDSINPKFLRPSAFSWVGALLLLLLTLISVALAYGPAPNIPLGKNPIILSLSVVLAASALLLVLPPVFDWDWKAKYFGCTGLCVASFSLLSVVPCAVLFLYGKTTFLLNTAIALIYGVSHFVWCKRFLTVYDHIYVNIELRNMIYREESSVVYYSQRADKYLLEKFYKFPQEPHFVYFGGFLFLAFSLVPFMEEAKALAGIPFAHIFLIVGVLPFSWMCVGLGFRSFLIFYRYPSKITAETGKDVYVDLVGAFQALDKDVAKRLRKTIRRF